MDKKNTRIFPVILFSIISLVLTQCQNTSEISTVEVLVDEKEQPAIHEIDVEFVEFLSDYLVKLTQKSNFSGVVLFARGEQVFFYRAYGLASREYNAVNTPETRFNMASVSKMFTSVIIAKLVEDGLLSFNDPIGDFLDTDWVSNEVGDEVQISHLLNHTSGLGHYWEKFDEYIHTIQDLDDYKPIIDDTLAFEPGTDYQYSNSGYLLLGIIIEEITGKSYYENVQRMIFEPIGMADSGFFMLDEPHQKLATGYFEDEEDSGKLKNNLSLHGVRGSSAGGGWSTGADMLRFFLALRSNRLVSSEMREILWTPEAISADYGYGFQIEENWVGHWGGFPGIEAFAMYFPASDHTIIIFSNYWDSALPLIGKLERWYPKLNDK